MFNMNSFVCLQVRSDKMAASVTVLTMVAIGLLACDVTSASRILMLPSAHRSTVIYFMEGGAALQKAGHEIYMLVR